MKKIAYAIYKALQRFSMQYDKWTTFVKLKLMGVSFDPSTSSFRGKCVLKLRGG